MTTLRRVVDILRDGAAVGFADYAAMFTWRSWSTAWLGRVVAQVVFFALIGRLLGDRDTLRFLLVGNAVFITVIESVGVIASTSWERRAGTLPLLVAAPSSPTLVFLGRSVQWLASGLGSATVAFFAAAAIFGLALPWPRVLLVVPLTLAVSVSSYLFASFLAALVLRAMEWRNIVSNVTYLMLMAICGVNVPLAFWPGWVQAIASVLPVTHGLAAVRALLDGAPLGAVAAGAALELLVGGLWLLPSLAAFRLLVERGRRDGSIEFAT